MFQITFNFWVFALWLLELSNFLWSVKHQTTCRPVARPTAAPPWESRRFCWQRCRFLSMINAMFTTSKQQKKGPSLCPETSNFNHMAFDCKSSGSKFSFQTPLQPWFSTVALRIKDYFASNIFKQLIFGPNFCLEKKNETLWIRRLVLGPTGLAVQQALDPLGALSRGQLRLSAVLEPSQGDG